MHIKRIIVSILFLLGGFLFLQQDVQAETFHEGDFIGNEYIGRTKEGKTTVSHIRFIEDEQGRKVYCIEPFLNFSEEEIYNSYHANEYFLLNEETKRKISLIAYFGYGYRGRESDYWYAITQFLIWQTIAPEGDIFFKNFTTGLREDARYLNERNAILEDVENYEKIANVERYIPTVYGDTIEINLPEQDFEIIESPFEYTLQDSLIIKDLKETGTIKYKQKDETFYKNDIMFYISHFSQNLLLPGNIISPIFEVTIEVYKGNIIIEIEEKKDAYSIESSYQNVCYEIYMEEYNKKVIMDTICTNKDIVYETKNLPIGDFYIKQISTGEGYLVDETIYEAGISYHDNKPKIHIINKLIKNNISLTKYFCKEEECHFEENVEFAIYDKENNLVTTLKTDERGNASYMVGYGTYRIEQITGLEGYELIRPYEVKVLDTVSNLHKDLYNQFIKVEEPVIPGKPIEVPKEDPINPPKEDPTEKPKEEPITPPIEVPKEDPPKKPVEEPIDEPINPEAPKEEEIEIPISPDPEEEEVPSYEEPPITGIKESLSSYIIYMVFVPFLSLYIVKKKG